jgi:glycosyltransferase involved in cell wall biosynthesis
VSDGGARWRFVAPAPAGPVEPGPVPTFSMIVAAYNVADLIGDALDSAFSQTVPPHEVIVCDDGSTDDIDRALEPYRDRIILLRHERNEHRGQAATKNAIVEAATGDYVAMLDADDVDLPERIEALGALASARPDLDFVTTDAWLVEDGVRVRRYYYEGHRFPVDDQRREILRRSWVFNPAVKRERWLEAGGYDPAFPSATDWECFIRLILSGSRVGLVDEPLVHYRQRPGRLTGDRVRLFDSRVRTLEKTQRTATSLDDDEREVLAATLRETRVRLAHEAIRKRHPQARAAALAVARTPGLTVRTRTRAALSAVSPALAHRLMR